ncbi:MAG: DUF2480 family protein [Bacteroidia bacterium]|nr:DUF2480 family protein [Bacteroidia bacterium]NNF30944.1 DUF2480 family protein [Flavobacteriaceae bacterium]MBT8275734.1 DUF2480 family protein [Bacteroidia bacterium]NNJ82351.1 DUF2480 family protein [Flavobacteriaceae bacterium]NNK54670.1 DUF2480 family protein [Flavobacteriaceae bacterium]
MSDEIVNRVANSKLLTIDLEEYYPEGERLSLDISQWLYEGFVLREKEFRAFVKDFDWSSYENTYLAVNCSTDAIVPAWAYMLISLEAGKYAKKVIFGDLSDMETVIYSEIISDLDVDFFRDKPVIIKGCTHKPIPENAYLLLAQRLQPVAKSIMYGEACSSVPLFKRK